MSFRDMVFQRFDDLKFRVMKRRAAFQPTTNRAISFRSPRDEESQRINRAVEEAQVQFQQQCPKCHFGIEFPNSPPASDGFCPSCGSMLDSGQPSTIESDFGTRIFSRACDQRGTRRRG